MPRHTRKPNVVSTLLSHSLHGVDSCAQAGTAVETAQSRHSPVTPFSSWVPRSSNEIPEPATRSFTVLETSTSPAPASAATRAPVCTAMP